MVRKLVKNTVFNFLLYSLYVKRGNPLYRIKGRE